MTNKENPKIKTMEWQLEIMKSVTAKERKQGLTPEKKLEQEYKKRQKKIKCKACGVEYEYSEVPGTVALFDKDSKKTVFVWETTGKRRYFAQSGDSWILKADTAKVRPGECPNCGNKI